MITTLAAGAAIALAARALLMVALHVVGREHNPIRDAVSDYAVGRTSRLSAAAAWLNAVGAGLLAVAFANVHHDAARHTELLWLLGLYAVLAAVVILVPTDLPGAKPTVRGRLHMLVAVASFTLAFLLVNDLTPVLAGLPGWGSVAGLLTVLRWLTEAGLVALVAAMLLRPLKPWFGLCERLFLYGFLAWLLTVAVTLAVVG